MGGYAWVTLATNDAYSLGALVLAHSLRRVGTKYEMAVLITPGVTQTMREKLSAVFSVVMEVNVLDSKDEANLALLARPELGVTFTKLHCWRLTQYEKCVFLDADTLVVRNCDELFEREELSAAPDVGWPDCFNSGVFVYRPSQQTFASITAFAAAKGSFDGGDQGLLNMYFSDWARKDISNHLPFIYNMCSTATYSYLPAFKQFGDDVRIIHFIGITKPWLQYFDTLTGIVQPPMGSVHLQPLLQLWWNIFCEKVHPQLSPVMATSTLAPIWHKFSPVPVEFHVPKAPIYTNIQDKLQNDIIVERPDFSEFLDPWENYYVQDDSIIYTEENNETQQYYFTVNNLPLISTVDKESTSPKSVHQTYYESPPGYNKNFYHKQQYSEYYSSSHNQKQSDQYVNVDEQQHSSFHPKDTSIPEVQPNYWQTQHSIEHCIPVHSLQSHHSNESQYQYDTYQCTAQSTCYDSNRLVSHKIAHQQQVDYQHSHQHSPIDSNNSQSVDVKQYQHSEPYIHYQCSPSQMYDNVNNKPVSRQYEHENQLLDSNSQSGFKYEDQTFLDIKVDHNQTIENSIAYQNHLSSKQSTEQDKDISITDERTNILVSTSPHPHSIPCIDIHNVAPQSDPHIGDDLNRSNAGLAGALAQMTLGEPRSAEQIALEEHMRKQSWEQGHIDYMGRDSFDNIWKKICETLALAPPRLPSPPKETQEPEETRTDKTGASVISPESVQTIESADEVDKGTAQASSHTEEQYLVNNVPITRVPKLLEENEQVIDATSSVKVVEDDVILKFSTESRNETLGISVDSSPTDVSTSHKNVTEFSSSSLLKRASQQITGPVVMPDSIQPHLSEEQEAITTTGEIKNDAKNVQALEISVDIPEIEQSHINVEKHAKELSTASEILTISPVPIQVAESVLQVEPKESILDSQLMPQEVLSSTITPVHVTEPENKLHINGSTLISIDVVNTLSELPKESIESSQISASVKQIQFCPIKTLQISESESNKTEDCPKEAIESTIETTSESEKSKTSVSAKIPVRPSRAKDLSVSSTSVLKSTHEEKSLEKATKKTVKKSSEKSVSEGEPTEITDGDSTGKKVTRKVVKKVTKKAKTKSEEGLDDGTEDSSSASKQKKAAKVVKKGTKSSQAATTDPADSKTPSSSTSDTPVPPKRKTKTAAAKTATKKSDIDQ